MEHNPQNSCTIRLKTYRKCFSRSSHGDANHVQSTQGNRPALALDRCGVSEILVPNHSHEVICRGSISDKISIHISGKRWRQIIHTHGTMSLPGKLASWKENIGLGQRRPLTVISLLLLNSWISCCRMEKYIRNPQSCQNLNIWQNITSSRFSTPATVQKWHHADCRARLVRCLYTTVRTRTQTQDLCCA